MNAKHKKFALPEEVGQKIDLILLDTISKHGMESTFHRVLTYLEKNAEQVERTATVPRGMFFDAQTVEEMNTLRFHLNGAIKSVIDRMLRLKP